MNGPDPDSDIGRRLEPRIRARLYAQLVSCQQMQSVYIESLSSNGAGLSAGTLPAVGTEVVLSWQAHDLLGTIVWARGQHCGLTFAEPLPQDVVDGIVRTGKRGRYVRDLHRAPQASQL